MSIFDISCSSLVNYKRYRQKRWKARHTHAINWNIIFPLIQYAQRNGKRKKNTWLNYWIFGASECGVTAIAYNDEIKFKGLNAIKKPKGKSIITPEHGPMSKFNAPENLLKTSV